MATLDDFADPLPRPPGRDSPTGALPQGATPAPPPEATAGVFDLRELKAESRRLLPSGHPVRVVVEAEPDFLQGPEAVGRMTVILRLILAHRRPQGVG